MRFRLQSAGVLLFLFIPAVLYLFVAHPEPLVASLVGGVVLMLGHRFLALPYAERVRAAKCIWCNRWLDEGAAAERVTVADGASEVVFAACPGHAAPAHRFFVWVDRRRLPLRLGIALPLLALLVALGLAAAGRTSPLPVATDLFRLVVGITVNAAAWGPFVPAPAGSVPRAAFPLHNFSLLGVRAILWIFRLVGLWWIVSSAWGLLAAPPD